MSAPCCTISNQMKYYTGVFLSELILNELYSGHIPQYRGIVPMYTHEDLCLLR